MIKQSETNIPKEVRERTTEDQIAEGIWTLVRHLKCISQNTQEVYRLDEIGGLLVRINDSLGGQ